MVLGLLLHIYSSLICILHLDTSLNARNAIQITPNTDTNPTMSALRSLTRLHLRPSNTIFTNPTFIPLTRATYSTIPNTKNSPQGPNKPASETSGTSASSSKTTADTESKDGVASAPPDNADGKGPMKQEEENTSDSRHPAKQPDSQEKPTRSTGIGGDRAVSSREGSG